MAKGIHKYSVQEAQNVKLGQGGYMNLDQAGGSGGGAGTDNTGSEITWRDFASNDTGSSNVNPTSAGSGTGGIARTFSLNDVIVSDVATNGNNSNKSSVTINFGQDSSFSGVTSSQGETDSNGKGDFYYTVPSGFLALCSANLEEPTISPNSDTQATNYFNTVLWTGNNNARSIEDVGFQPDFVWSKCRNTNSTGHRLHDSVRGDNGTVMLELNSDSTQVEGTDTLISGFDAEGFNIAAGGNHPNVSNRTFVAWNWKAGGEPTATNSASAGATPTAGSVKIDGVNKSVALAGSIPATKISASTTAGFSIVTYTGNDASSATVGHGLTQAPEWVIVKNRGEAISNPAWTVYHASNTSAPATDYLDLSTNTGTDDADTLWNDTAPTSTVVSLGTADSVLSGSNHVMYCFHSVEGYSKFGSYVGNGAANGTFVNIGFRPAFVMIKCSSHNSSSWFMLDNARDVNNEVLQDLTADTNNDETSNSNFLDFLSNGFKLRTTGSVVNGSGRTMIYMAFAEAPFKYANAR